MNRFKFDGLKGTKTEANLQAAFAGESQARNKYTYYASKARKEGYEQVAELFEETALNEREHAKMWFKILHGGEIPGTEANLIDAAAGEHYEFTDMYFTMAKDAKAEGFDTIAMYFESVGKIEKRHEDRYNKLRANLVSGEIFKRADKTDWVCRNCGHVHEGLEAPAICAVCGHDKSYFEIEATNF